MVEAFLESLIKGVENLGWSSSKRIAEHTDWALEEIEQSLSKLVEEKRILLRKKGRGFQYGPLDNKDHATIRTCDKVSCRTNTQRVNDNQCRECMTACSDKASKRLESLSSTELKQTFIDVGILTSSGQLTEVYGGKPTSLPAWDAQKMCIPLAERIPQVELKYLEPATHHKIDIIDAAHIILAELPRHEFLGKIERNVYSISEIVERLVERWGYLKAHAYEAVMAAIEQKKTIIHMQQRYVISDWVSFLYRPKDDITPEPPVRQEAGDQSWVTTNAQLGTATANA